MAATATAERKHATWRPLIPSAALTAAPPVEKRTAVATICIRATAMGCPGPLTPAALIVYRAPPRPIITVTPPPAPSPVAVRRSAGGIDRAAAASIPSQARRKAASRISWSVPVPQPSTSEWNATPVSSLGKK